MTLDTGAVDNGNANPAQRVLDVKATLGHKRPHDLLIYAFGAHLGAQNVLTEAQRLAKQSHIPMGNLTLINRQSTYATTTQRARTRATSSSRTCCRSWVA